MLEPPHSSPPVNPIADGLPRMLLELFQDKGAVRKYTRGELILGPGMSGEEVRFVLSGRASVVLGEKEGEKIAVTALSPGDLFGGVEFFFGVPWSVGAELLAEEECLILELNPYIFEEVLRGHPDFSTALIRKLVRTATLLERRIHEHKLKKKALRRLISREDHLFPDYIMGEHVKRRLGEQVEQLARTPGSLVIFGESGVGKEGVAHYLFSKSLYYTNVFLMLDALGTREKHAEQVRDAADGAFEKKLTDEQRKLLFGAEDRTAMGRVTERSGYLELADDGTLLLRGADKLTVAVQLQLLEALRQGFFSRKGCAMPITASVRIIATTRLLASEVSPDTQPLLWALMERSVHVPPLRTRRREIPGLVDRYLRKYGGELKQPIHAVPGDTLRLLVDYPWPGNDLELAATLKQAVGAARHGIIKPEDIQFQRRRLRGKTGPDLLKSRIVRQALESPLFPAVLQGAALLFFTAMLAALLFGPPDPLKNIGSMFAWSVGWPLLIIGSFVWARFWCSLCPVGLVGEVAAKIACLGRPLPSFMKKRPDFVLAAAVILVIWIEAAAGLRDSPFHLGLLLFAMLLSAIAASMVFEPQAWCLHLCGLGGIMGVLAKTSALELRADPNVCISQCVKNVCYWGTERYPGCPYGQSGPKLDNNRLCKLCGLCVKNCGHNAFSLNLRAPGKEIWSGGQQPRTGTAFLIIGLLAGLMSELMTKAPWFETIVTASGAPVAIIFTILFIAVILAANGVMSAAALVSARFIRNAPKENYARFALAYLPLVLTSFAAFHLYFFAAQGELLLFSISAIFDPSAIRPHSHDAPGAITTVIRVILLWGGCAWTMLAIHKAGRNMAVRRSNVLVGVLPHILSALATTLLLHRSFQWFFHS